MNKITSANFVKGIKGTDSILYNGIPQIAFIGRSNVGKSSVINSLVSKKGLAKSSKTPGRTTEINFFSINNNKLYFVDLPGYGYAKLSDPMRDKIAKHIVWYLTSSEVKPVLVVLIIDSRVGLTDFDKETIELLEDNNQACVIVANKIDKLNQKELSKQLNMIREDAETNEIIPYSAKTKKGVKELLDKFSDYTNA